MLNFAETQRSPGQKAGALTELKISGIDPMLSVKGINLDVHAIEDNYKAISNTVATSLSQLNKEGAGISMSGILGKDAASTHLSSADIANSFGSAISGRLIP